MERYCKTCAIRADKLVPIRSPLALVAHIWAKHGPSTALARWLLKRRIKSRREHYARYPWGSSQQHTYDLTPKDYEHWEVWVYGDNLDPHKYDL